MRPFSTLRLTLLRACYAILVVGLANLPRMDGVVVALLSALGVFSVAGLFSPIRMLPLLVFESAWKLIWVSAVALPKWLDGSLDEGTFSILFNCAVALPFVLIVPWRHVVGAFLGTRETFRAAATAEGSAA